MNIYSLHTEEKSNTAELYQPQAVWYCSIQFIAAMNYNQAWFAMEQNEWQHIIWLMAHNIKSSDYKSIQKSIRAKVKAIIYLGSERREVHQSLATCTVVIARASSGEEALKMAEQLYQVGDVIIVSPTHSVQHFINQF